MQFGVPADPATTAARVTSPEITRQMLDLFLARGHRELDTARMYMGGNTEKFLAEVGLEGFEVATKAYPATGDHPGFTPENIRRQLDESLAALKTTSVDLFYLHWPDHKTPLETTLRAVDELYRENKFRRFGISNYSAALVEQIVVLCAQHGWVKPSVYQGMYNMITRAVEPELFPLLRKHGIAFYVYNVTAGGVLTGRYTYEDQPDDGRFSVKTVWGNKYRERYWKRSLFDELEKVKAACSPHGITLLEASIRWMYWHSALQDGDAVILGASSVKHLADNLGAAAATSPLPADVVEAIERTWEAVKSECPPYER